MSDVEWICEQNHQRVRWAEELAGEPARTADRGKGLPRGTATPPSRQSRDTSPCTGEALRIATPPMAARNDSADRRDRKRRILRTASLFCAMMCGVSMACVVRGAVMGDAQTLVPGVIGAVVFLTSGWLMDEQVEVLSV